MLRKLLKHEFRATGRIMLPMYLVLLLTAVGSNISGRWMIGSDLNAVSILGVLIVTAFGFAIAGVFVVAFWLMIQRFYKNLLQDEGYLMFTLPVSVHQHIWAKLIVSAVWMVATVLAVIAAGMVVAYDVGFLREVFHVMGEFFRGFRLLKVSESLNGIVYLAEFAALCFLGLVAFALQFYAALAAGHSRPNHKMVWSVVSFFAFQFALQFGGSLLFIGINSLDLSFSLNINVADVGPAVAIHVGFLFMIFLEIVYGGIFYAVTTFFLKRHLNLE